MIVASMRTQYGLSLYGQEFNFMKWKEFRSLLAGLNSDTPLGRVVQIRAETNPDIIKEFTSSQRKIYDDWQKKSAKEASPADMEKFLNQMLKFFVTTGDVIEKDKV